MIFKKWEQKTKELSGPKKMRTFESTKKGQKVKEKKTDSTPGLTTSASTPVATGDENEDDSNKNKSVQDARKAMKDRFKTKSKSSAVVETPVEEPVMETKGGRTWFDINMKVSKKDMDKIDLSRDKGGEIDIERQRDIYLTGADENIEGFYDSSEEIDFENFKSTKKGGKKGGGLFNKLTSAFQNLTGNKVLTEEDLAPILKQFAESLMEKNVASEIAE